MVIRAFVEPQPFGRRFDLHIQVDKPGEPNTYYVLDRLQFKKRELGFEAPPPVQLDEPLARHDMQQLLQAIVDAAWDAGIRPIGAKESAGEIKRIEHHLADMQKLVFKDKGGTR